MMPIRFLAAVLAIAGVGLGSLGQRPAAQSAQSVDGYFMLAADLHVHAVPGDGALTPRRLREEARRRRLDVIAITNHNQTHAVRLMPSTDDRPGEPIVLLGEEVTHPAYHLIAIGIHTTVDWNQPAANAIDEVHAQGGIAIAAHPTREYWAGWDDDAVIRLDGVEAAHSSREESDETERQFDLFVQRTRSRKPSIALIGSSDFHVHDQPGRCRTFVFARERSPAGVIEAIRSGRTVAEAADGRLFGDAALVRLVHDHRNGETQPRQEWHIVAPAIAWLGIAGLLLLPRPSPPDGGRK